MGYKIISQQIGSPDSAERVEIDNIENPIDALYFLDCKRQMEEGNPGVKIEANGTEFKALSEDGKKGTTFKIKQK